MNKFVRNMVFFASLIASSNGNARDKDYVHSEISFYTSINMGGALAYGGIAAVGGAVIWGINHISKRCTIKKTSLENYVNQLRYKLHIAQDFLDDYDAYTQGLLDAAINARCSIYPYPAFTYLKNLNTLLKDLSNLQSVFMIKKAQSKNTTEKTQIDRIIQVIIIVKMRLEVLKEVIQHSRNYHLEKEACRWPIKTALVCFATGAVGGYLAKEIDLLKP